MATLVDHQKTCPVCLKPLLGTATELEPLVDPGIRYILVHHGCTTFVHRDTATAVPVPVTTAVAS